MINLKTFPFTLGALLLFGMVFQATSAFAATTITVTTTVDEINTNGLCSLREAVINANNDDQSGSIDCSAGIGDDSIAVPAGMYVLDKVGHSEDASITGDLDIWSTYKLEIIGSGIGSTVIDGNGMGSTHTDDTDNVFHITEGDISFQDLTIQNAGTSKYPSSMGAGAWLWHGIYAYDSSATSLSLDAVEVIDNQGNGLYVGALAPIILSIEASKLSNNNQHGAEIYADYSTFDIKSSDFNQNGSDGSQLYGNFLTISVDQSHFDNNNHFDGLEVNAADSIVEITNSSFQYNKSDGFESTNPVPTTIFSISDSIFDNNGSNGLHSDSAQMNIENSSFNNNSGDGILFWGGIIATIDSSEFSNNGQSGMNAHSLSDDEFGWIKLVVTKSSITGNNESGIGLEGMYSTESDYTNLEVKNSIISGNSAEYGGGIYSTGGTMVISDSFITNNDAEKDGGGIWYQDSNEFSDDYEETLYIENAEISDNTAQLGAGGIYVEGLKKLGINRSILEKNQALNGSGGGLWIVSSLESFITFSTFDSNQASIGSGGGIYNSGNGYLSIDSSTMSANKATSYGGGLYHEGGALDILTSTISGNKALNGPGLYNAVTSGVVNVFNTTIVGNSFEIASGTIVNLKSTLVQTSNLVGKVTSLGYNIDQGKTWKFTAATDKSNAYAKLSGLANNGGPTKTHALSAGSIAIDRGNATTTYDQRGTRFARSIDGNGDGTPTPDVGAYEYDPLASLPGNL